MTTSAGLNPGEIDFTAGAPVGGSPEPAWIHGAPRRRACTDPPVQVHRSEPHTVILRVSKAVSAEAPFLFLLFGNNRALLLDTGPSADAAKVPVRRVTDELIAGWLEEHPRADYELVVAHTHGHTDHRGGDPQFAGRALTTVVGHAPEDVRAFFGFDRWPDQVVRLDLGGRVLEVTGTPGHHRASVTVWDPWTGFLLTGDTILPGRLYAGDYPAFLHSLEQLEELAAQRPVTRVLGCHIEMSVTPGRDYPAGATYQPDEVPLALPPERIAQIRAAARAATRPGVYRHDDFIIWHGGQRIVPVLGQAARLLAYNWSARRAAGRPSST